MQRKHDPDIIECTDCGADFDLAAQHYYDSTCPSCIDEERTYMGCCACDNELPPKHVGYAQAAGYDGTEMVPVCSEGCRDMIETPRHSPHGPSMHRGENPFWDGLEE